MPIHEGEQHNIFVYDISRGTRTRMTFEGANQSAVWSPDGKQITDRPEVYVQPYPGPGARTRISVEGGRHPAWARDGQELFYRIESGRKRKMMAVNITTDPAFIAGKPRMLFEEDRYEWTFPLRSYDVAADGRFLMLEVTEQPSERVTQLRVVLNWFEELKRLVPTDK